MHLSGIPRKTILVKEESQICNPETGFFPQFSGNSLLHCIAIINLAAGQAPVAAPSCLFCPLQNQDAAGVIRDEQELGVRSYLLTCWKVHH